MLNSKIWKWGYSNVSRNAYRSHDISHGSKYFKTPKGLFYESKQVLDFRVLHECPMDFFGISCDICRAFILTITSGGRLPTYIRSSSQLDTRAGSCIHVFPALIIKKCYLTISRAATTQINTHLPPAMVSTVFKFQIVFLFSLNMWFHFITPYWHSVLIIIICTTICDMSLTHPSSQELRKVYKPSLSHTKYLSAVIQ